MNTTTSFTSRSWWLCSFFKKVDTHTFASVYFPFQVQRPSRRTLLYLPAYSPSVSARSAFMWLRPMPSRNACFVIVIRSLLHLRPMVLLPEIQKNALLNIVFHGIMRAEPPWSWYRLRRGTGNSLCPPFCCAPEGAGADAIRKE